MVEGLRHAWAWRQEHPDGYATAARRGVTASRVLLGSVDSGSVLDEHGGEWW